jgi:hypothetical protein
MYTISFDKEALSITICNLYSGIELTYPVYYSNGTTCQLSPNQQTDIGNTVEASFGIYSKWEGFKGALLCKIQREYAIRTDNQPSSSAASIESTAANIYFVVAWNVVYRDHKFYVCSIECTDDFTWDEDKLWALHWEYNNQFKDCDYETITWLMNDGIVIETKLDVTYGLDYKLDIVISEGTRRYTMFKSMKIDPRRSVLTL